jgi:hypothetical protein
MGCVTLRQLLIKRVGSISIAARDTGISINRLYDATSRGHSNIAFTEQEKQILMAKYFTDGKFTKEEVFRQNEDPAGWHFRQVSAVAPRGGRKY